MKKSLVALAALAAVGAASAQSSVTLYGLVDIGYGSHTTTTRDGTGSIRTRGVMDGANAGNRIGFRGTEDLGGGLKANFVVEQGISPTTGQLFGVRAAASGHQVDGFSNAGVAQAVDGSAGSYGTNTNRQSYLGLTSASVGTFNIGYQYAVFYELSTLSGYNIGSEGLPGASKAHLQGQYNLGGIRNNMIQYISPNFGGGFTARVQYGAGTGRESVEKTTTAGNGLTTDKNRRYGLMLQYANGPVSVAAAYSNQRTTQANNSASGPAAAQTTNVLGFINGAQPFVAGAALTGNTRTASEFQLGGSYDFGVAKVAGTYNTGRNSGTAGGVGPASVDGRNRAYQIGVSAPFGAIVPFVTFGRAYTQPDVGVRSEDYKQYQVGVRYSLSKRTTAYAFYGQTKNEAAALAGASSFFLDKKTIVGVAHSF